MTKHENLKFNTRTSVIKSMEINEKEATIIATPKFFDSVNTEQFGAKAPVASANGLLTVTIPNRSDNVSEVLCCMYETASYNPRSGISHEFILQVANAEMIGLDVDLGPGRY